MSDKKKNTKIADMPKKAVSTKKASAVKGGGTQKPPKPQGGSQGGN